MVARLLGLPGTDLDRLLGWAMTGGELLAGTADLARMTQLTTETARLHAYLDHHLDAALAAPPANLLGDLAQAVRDGQLDRDHARGILVVLVGAGGESTASLIGSATRLVASDPALQGTLRADPAALPTFVEEVVRLESPFKGHYRVVRHPTTLGGQVLPAGHRLLLLWAAANRDAATFAEPDTIDLTRRVPRQHLGFGRGIHFCVGAPLARLEARVVLEELLARTSDVALDAARPPVHIPSIFVRRLAHLHLRLR
jgi:cytochrome P450